MELRNKGVIRLNPSATRGDTASLERTLVVSGVARSGTSMVAGILQAAGVPLGERMDQVVFEDNDFAKVLEREPFDEKALQRLLRARDRRHPVWGFKRPHLHVHGARAVELCRNPHLILTVRDPVAIAERNAISEHRDPARVLTAAMQDLQDMLTFAESLHCPMLLVSYEKAVRNPAQFVRTLLEFCGLAVADDMIDVLSAMVEPDRPAYIESARRVFDGHLDSVRRTVLIGWARQRLSQLPVVVTLFRDGVAVQDVVADRFRGDLKLSEGDEGLHGFEVDLRRHGFTARSVVSVRIQGRSFELSGSGSTVAALGGSEGAFEIRPIWPWPHELTA